MRTLKVLALLAAALCAAVFLFAVATMPPRAVVLSPSTAPTPGQVIAGAYHIHSVRSDGTGTVEEIAAAAARAGLRFIILTDHGDGTRPPDPPAYRSGVLCLDGVEISTTAGHYAAIGMRASPYPLAGEARDVVDDVARLGGFGVAAHPDSPKAALRWREWAAPVGALEWLNGDSEWRDESRWQLAHLMLEYALRPPESLAALFGRPAATLARWDALTRQRPVVALAAADAHARLGWRGGGDPYRGGASLHLPSYEAIFRTFAVRLVLDEPPTGQASTDAARVRDALAAGHVYTAVDAFAAPPDLQFTARSGPYVAHGGDTLTLAGPVDLEARVNASDARVTLIEDGRPVTSGDGAVRYHASARRAVYRVEVTLPRRGANAVPWILSNPIYAGGPVDARQPVSRADPTESTPVAAGSGWFIERERRSEGSFAIVGPGAVSFRYDLAPGTRANQFAALVHRVNGLAAFDRLQFRARAAQPMRLSVQVRVMNGATNERWQRSIYLDREARDVTVFLDDVRPIGPTSHWQPDLSKVSSILLVVDTVNARPGTSGEVALQDVRFAR